MMNEKQRRRERERLHREGYWKGFYGDPAPTVDQGPIRHMGWVAGVEAREKEAAKKSEASV